MIDEHLWEGDQVLPGLYKVLCVYSQASSRLANWIGDHWDAETDHRLDPMIESDLRVGW